MKRAFVRHVKRWPKTKQMPLLEAAGVKKSVIYVDAEWASCIKSLLPGDKLLLGGGLRVLGDNRKEILAALEQIKAKGAVAVDAETGREAGNDDAAELLDEAMRKLQGGAVFTAGEVAQQMQAKSAAKRVANRMPEREAKVIWHDPKLTVEEAWRLCKGWPQRTLYKTFGPRNVGAGRRPKVLKQ
jgi:hypothetical protein